ncbi:MAG: hypothetical protein RL026_682 [Pseudomonadota bacterium]|jgi:biopolymer transport protein ExbD
MKMSARARRMLVHHLRNRTDAEINLIPMIDILSVLVAFLLVYSTEVEVVQNTQGIQIPESVSESRPRETVVVTLTPEALFVQGERIASLDEVRREEGPQLAALQRVLQRPRLAPQDQEITIMGDKRIAYEVLRKVMHTCTAAGYGRVSLALVQKDKTLDPATFTPL